MLDHGGPDFAFIQYGAALKFWLLGALVVGALVPAGSGSVALNLAGAVAGMLALAALVGVVESVMARLRLVVVPQFLVGAGALATVAWLLATQP